MPEYKSPNGFGDSAPSMSDDFEPSSADVEKWQEEGGPAPEADSSVENERESGDQPPAKEEPGTYKDAVQKPEEKGKPQTPLQKHREQKRQSSADNELHKQIRILSKENRDLKAEKAKRDQGIDQKPEDWEALAAQFDQYGDYAKAQDARKEAERIRQAQAQYQQSEAFVERWHANEAEIMEQDPDLFNPETETGRRLGELFNDPKNAELAARYRGHPDGIWAAYHRVKAEYATELIPKLVQVIEAQQAELAKFKKSSAPMKSSPSGGSHQGPKSLRNMSDEELEKHAYAEAAEIDAGRR
jgi:hypothetical protein